MEGLTHAGGIVVRKQDGRRYLLVRPKAGLQEWVFPKGHIERLETPEMAALREVREEAGVEGDIVAYVGTDVFVVSGEKVRTAYYLIRFIRSVSRLEDRERRWCRYKEALKLLTFDDARALLRKAHTLA